MRRGRLRRQRLIKYIRHCSPTAEATDSKSVQCGFDSHQCYSQMQNSQPTTGPHTILIDGAFYPQRIRCDRSVQLIHREHPHRAITLWWNSDPANNQIVTPVWVGFAAANPMVLEMPILNGRVYLNNGYAKAFFREIGREIWEELVREGWRQFAHGVHPPGSRG